METALEAYRRIVADQPICDERLFAEALARYRSGEESAARVISASFLRLALEMAEPRSAGGESRLFDLIQEANAGLMEAIADFTGGNLQEFLPFARDRIERRLTILA